MNRLLDKIESSQQNHHLVGIGTDEAVSHASQTTQVLPPGISHGVPFHLSHYCETIPPPATIVLPLIVPTTDDTRLAEQEARVERLDSRMRQIKLQNRGLTQDDTDDIPVPILPTKFRMLDIEHYSGVVFQRST